MFYLVDRSNNNYSYFLFIENIDKKHDQLFFLIAFDSLYFSLLPDVILLKIYLHYVHHIYELAKFGNGIARF